MFAVIANSPASNSRPMALFIAVLVIAVILALFGSGRK